MVVEAALKVLTNDDTRDGDLNYLVSSILDKLYPRNYKNMNAAIGTLECIKAEYYRRIVAPYEDYKIAKNGDVYDNFS